ncbi:MAG: cytochrome PufQ [Pseudomonadota bacterium]
MTDMTSNVSLEARGKKSIKAEFTVYFAIIFVVAIPLATLSWLLTTIKSGRLTGKGPLARAWSQARIITPMIFNA